MSLEQNTQQSCQIHATAVISPKAELGCNVLVGPYCCIGPEVKLGDNVKLFSHVVINGKTTIGSHTEIYSFACLGDPPQDLHDTGALSELIIGSHNRIGHYVSMNGGTEKGGFITRIGNYNFFMDGSHVGHDCQIGNHNIFTNHVLLAGHVNVENHVNFGGASAVAQFVRIGQGSMIAASAVVTSDLIPYGYAFPSDGLAMLRGLNIIGMKRLEISEKEILATRKAYRQIFANDNNLFETRLQAVKQEFATHTYVQEIINFIESDSKKALCKPIDKN